MKKKINNDSDRGGSTGMRLFVFGASLAGLAAAYFFLGPKSKKNLANTKSWAIKMKGDVVEKLEQAREVSETIYNDIIDSVATKYEKKLKSNSDEIKALAQDLKTHWQSINRSTKARKLDNSQGASKPTKSRKITKKL